MKTLPQRFVVRSLVPGNGVDKYGRRALDWGSDSEELSYVQRVWTDAYDWSQRIVVDVTDEAILQRF